MAKPGVVGSCPLSPEFAANNRIIVVVRTGDHTFIGRLGHSAFLTLVLIVCSLGQIASLTGGETGNESPLAVEMYGCLIVRLEQATDIF